MAERRKPSAPMAAKRVRKDFNRESGHIGSSKRVRCALRKGRKGGLQKKEVIEANSGKSVYSRMRLFQYPSFLKEFYHG